MKTIASCDTGGEVCYLKSIKVRVYSLGYYFQVIVLGIYLFLQKNGIKVIFKQKDCNLSFGFLRT